MIVSICVDILEYGKRDFGVSGEEILQNLDDMNIFGGNLMAIYLQFCRSQMYTLVYCALSRSEKLVEWAKTRYPLVVRSGAGMFAVLVRGIHSLAASVFPLLESVTNYREMLDELMLNSKDLNPFDYAMLLVRKKDKGATVPSTSTSKKPATVVKTSAPAKNVQTRRTTGLHEMD